MSHKVNLVRVLTAATGNSSPIQLDAAYSQLFMTPAEAGAMNGRIYSYLIVDGNNWEYGRGVYTSSGNTLARNVIASRSGGLLGASRINLTGTAQVRFVELAEDMDGVRGTRAVTGTSDTLVNSDQGYVVTYNNAAAIAVSLAQPGSSGLFLDGWATTIKNKGAGAVTITPAASTIDGAATLVLAQNQGAMIWSDGTNYQSLIFRGDVGVPLRADAAQSLTSAQQIQAKINIGIGAFGQARLTKVGSNVVLSPKNGNLITIGGATCAIPDAGVSLAATGLSAGTLYYIYAVATSGVVTSLEASTTGHSTSTTAGNKGVEIKTGDDTRSLVGMVRPTAGPAFTDTKSQRFVRSWFNDNSIVTGNAFTSTQNVAHTSTFEIDTSIRNEFLTWAGEQGFWTFGGQAYSNTLNTVVSTGIGVDSSVTAAPGFSYFEQTPVNINKSFIATASVESFTEGYHFVTGVHRNDTGTISYAVSVYGAPAIAGRVGR